MRTPLILLFFFLNFYFFKNDILPSLDSLLDGPKFNSISYEKLLQDSQAKLTRVLLGISQQTETLQMTIETLLKLVEKGFLDEYQVITVWKHLAKKEGDKEERKEEERRRIREYQRKEEEGIRMKEEEWIKRMDEEGMRKKEKEARKNEEEEWKTREIEGMRWKEEEKMRKREEEGRRRKIENDRRNSDLKKEEEKKEEEKRKLEDDNRRIREENKRKNMDADREEREGKTVDDGREEMKKVEEKKNTEVIPKEIRTEKDQTNKTEEHLENKPNTNEKNEKDNLSNITNNSSIFLFERNNGTMNSPPSPTFPASSFSSFTISSHPSLPLLFGYFFLMLFLLLISLSLYRRDRHIILLLLLSFLLYNLFYLMISLQIENHIITIPGLIALNIALVFNFCIHLILIKLGLQKKLNSWKDIFLPHNSASNLSLSTYYSPPLIPSAYSPYPSSSFFGGREGFLIQAVISIVLCYFLCFFSASPLTQIGFWLSIYWGLNAIAGNEVRREEEVLTKEEDEFKKEEERGKKEIGGRKRKKEERLGGKKKEDEMKSNINSEKITGAGERMEGGMNERRLEEGTEGNIRGKLNPNILRPRWLLYMSVLSFLMIWYILVWDKESFKHLEEGRKKIMRMICHEEEIINMDVDFRYIGYFFCVLILNSLFPLFLYIQHKHLYNLFKTNSFTYKMVFQTFREDIGQERLNFNLDMYPYYIYFGMVVMLVFLGLRIKMAIVVIIPSFALQSYMGLIIKDRRIVWMIFFYFGSFFVLNATFFMDKQEDLLSIKVTNGNGEGGGEKEKEKKSLVRRREKGGEEEKRMGGIRKKKKTGGKKKLLSFLL